VTAACKVSDLSQNFAKSTALNAAASIAIIAGGFITTVIVARLLGPEAVGILAYAAFITTLSLAILDMGVPGTLLRFVPELDSDEQGTCAGALIRFFFVPYFAASTLYAIGLALLLDPATFSTAGRDTDGRMLVLLVAGAVLAQSLAGFCYGVLRGRRQFLSLAKLTIISALIQVATAWAGAHFFGVAGALAAPVAGFLLGASLALRSLAHRGASDKNLNIRALNFAWRTWGSYVLVTVAWSRMEIYFLKYSWGDHAAGLFAAGLNLSNLALQLPLLLTGALIPFLVAKSKAESAEQFAQSYATALRYFAMLVFPACFGAAAITPVLLPLIFGPSFTDAILPTMILIAGCSAMTFVTIVEKFSLAVEKSGAMLWFAALGAALAVLSGLTLTPLYGTVGAAGGRAMAQVMVAAAMILYAHRLGWRTPWGLTGILTASLVSAALAGIIVQLLPTASGIVLAVAAAALAYGVLLKTLHVFSDGDANLVDRAAQAEALPGLMRSGFALTAAWLRKG
jgi:O-antigen/teichoic acid export membrane protein